MELLLILIYTALCIAIFKIFRIPVNKWTLPTAALGGIFMIGLILIVTNYNHPFTNNARIYFTTTPVFVDVKGRVIEVPAKANEPLKQGDVLFRIDPKPYQFEVDQKRAALAEAEQNVAQLKAAFDSAQATVAEARPNATVPSRSSSASLKVTRMRGAQEMQRRFPKPRSIRAGRRHSPPKAPWRPPRKRPSRHALPINPKSTG